MELYLVCFSHGLLIDVSTFTSIILELEYDNNILIAHTLPGEVFGPAQNMHGATYIVDAEFFAKELNEFNIIMDLGVVTEILADVLKFYSYKNLDEIAEFNNIITTTEFLAKDIFNKITDKLKKDYSKDFKKLHKILQS